MLMIKADVPQDVTEYKEQFFFGMNSRQLICSVLMIVVAVLVFLVGSKFISTDILVYITIALIAPLAAVGFLKYNGMGFEKIAATVAEFYVSNQRRRMEYLPDEMEIHDTVRKIYIQQLEEERKAEVFLRPEEVSLAIGKGGLNIKLASMLTEYTIDVFRELDESAQDEDIYLEEFKDEIDGWVIDAIKAIGIDTAKAVLNAPREMLIEKTDLEEETVDEVLRILKSEFEDNE